MVLIPYLQENRISLPNVNTNIVKQ